MRSRRLDSPAARLAQHILSLPENIRAQAIKKECRGKPVSFRRAVNRHLESLSGVIRVNSKNISEGFKPINNVPPMLLKMIREIALRPKGDTPKNREVANRLLDEAYANASPFSPASIYNAVPALEAAFRCQLELDFEVELMKLYRELDYDGDKSSVDKKSILGMLILANRLALPDDGDITVSEMTYFRFREAVLGMKPEEMTLFLSSLFMHYAMENDDLKNLELSLKIARDGVDGLRDIVDPERLQEVLSDVGLDDVIDDDDGIEPEVNEEDSPDPTLELNFKKTIGTTISQLQQMTFEQLVDMSRVRQEMLEEIKSLREEEEDDDGSIVVEDSPYSPWYEFVHNFEEKNRMSPIYNHYEQYPEEYVDHLDWANERETIALDSQHIGLFNLSTRELEWLYQNAVTEKNRGYAARELAASTKKDGDHQKVSTLFENELKNKELSPRRRANALYGLFDVDPEKFFEVVNDVFNDIDDPSILHSLVVILIDPELGGERGQKLVARRIINDLQENRFSFPFAAVMRLGRSDGYYGADYIDMTTKILEEVFSTNYGVVVEEVKNPKSGKMVTQESSKIPHIFEATTKAMLPGEYFADGSKIFVGQHSVLEYADYLGLRRLANWANDDTKPILQNNALNILALCPSHYLEEALLPGSAYEKKLKRIGDILKL